MKIEDNCELLRHQFGAWGVKGGGGVSKFSCQLIPSVKVYYKEPMLEII